MTNRRLRIWSAVCALAASAFIAGATWAQPVYEVDFTDYKPEAGSVADWLRAKGFEKERDAKNGSKISLSADRSGLKIDMLARARGFLINRRFTVADYKAIEIEWGVTRFPQGASYDNGVNNEAIMVQIFLGAKRIESGSLLAPDAPYFVGIFLCQNDEVGRPYVGHYYTESGRYICVGSPTKDETVVSRFDLQSGPSSALGLTVDKDISAFAISADTTASGAGGKAAAFIRRIRFIP